MAQSQKSSKFNKKRPIRLTLSPQARENIEKEFVVETALASSISDFLEKIGLGELSVSSILDDAQPELLRLSASKRLLVLVKEPAAVFLSTLAFVLRVSRQLGLASATFTGNQHELPLCHCTGELVICFIQHIDFFLSPMKSQLSKVKLVDSE